MFNKKTNKKINKKSNYYNTLKKTKSIVNSLFSPNRKSFNKKKKIIIYQDRDTKNNFLNKVFLAILKGLNNKYKNYKIIYIGYDNFKLIKCDYAIIWNVYCKFKEDTKYREEIKLFQKKNKNKLIVIELGFIRRSDYFSIGYDHISNFGTYPNFPENQDRLKKLNLNIKNINYDKNPNKYILFCTQVPWDTQVQDINYTKWVIDSIKTLKENTTREIVVRKHPKHYEKEGFDFFDNNFFKKNNLDVSVSNNLIEDDFKNSYCVVAFNSTILVDAVIQGIPILSGSNTSIVNDICIKDFSSIENLHRFTNKEILKCLSLVAYKQWTLNEIKKGLPFSYYI